MKKLNNLILMLSLLSMIIICCDKSKNPIDSQSLTHSEAVGLSKGNPNVNPTIHYFTIKEYDQGVDPGPGIDPNWTRNLLDFEEADLDELIDFASDKWYSIEYDVSHPDGIAKVSMFFYYDANVDYQHQMEELEFVGYVLQEYNVTVPQTFDWREGIIIPTGGDNDAYSSDPSLLDQLATYNDSNAPVDGADHYGIFIWVESAGKQMRLNQKISYMWINAKSGLETFHVDNVEVDAEKVKGVIYTPTAKVTVSAEGVIVWGKWSGLAESNYRYKGGPSGVDGVVEIVGPDFKNNASGEVIFTVKTLRKVDGVYNPDENSNWDWPSVEPFGSLSVPIP